MNKLLVIVVALIGFAAAPRVAQGQTVLPRAGWVATASSSGSGDQPSNAIDGSSGSRWSSGADQTQGQWFSLDMITPQTLSQLTINPAGSENDFAIAYQVFVSNDAVTWSPVASGTGAAGILTVTFPTQTARFVGIVQTGSGAHWWSIAEINVYGPGGQPPAVPLVPSGWVATASATGGSDVASKAIDGALGTRWSSGTPQASGQSFQLDMLSARTITKLTMSSDGSTSDYARAFQVFATNNLASWGAAIASGTGTSPLVTVNLPQTSARYLKVVLTGGASSWWSIAELTVFAVGTFDPVAMVLPRTGWTASASASCSGDTPAKALDDNASSRFSTCQNQSNGQSFRVDMQSPKSFTKITLDADGSIGDYPRGYQVFISNDGTNWGSPIAAGTGTSQLVTITFPYQTARHIKVVQTGTASSNWWSIHELNVYGVPPLLLMRQGWIASASLNSSSAGSGIDGKLSTRWNTGAPQANGQWYQLDMLAPQTFNQVTLNADGFTSDYPRGYAVYASNNPASFGSPVATGIGSAAMVSIGFPAQTARYLRVVQTGSSSNWWSIAEANLYTTAFPAYGVPRADVTAPACSDGSRPIGCRSFDCSTGLDTGVWLAPPACTGAYPTCTSVCPNQGTALSSGALTPSGSIVQCSCSCTDSTGGSFALTANGCAVPGVSNPCQQICPGVTDPCGGAAGCSISQCGGGQLLTVLAANSCDPGAPESVRTSSIADWQAAVNPATSEMVVSIGGSSTHVPLTGTLSLNATSSDFELVTADVRAADFSFFGRQVVSPRLVLLRRSRLAPAQATDEFGGTSFQLSPGMANVVLSGVVDGQQRNLLSSNSGQVSGTFSPNGGVTLGVNSTPAPGTTVSITLRAALTHRPPVAAITGLPSVAECTSNGRATIHLNGTSSTSDGGSIQRYQWRERPLAPTVDVGASGVASTAAADVPLVLGAHQLTLNVYDDRGGTGSSSVNVSVVDTVAPLIQSPGDVAMIGVAGSAQVNLGWPVTSDACDPKPSIQATLVQRLGVPVNEPILDPTHVTLPVGAHLIRWSVRDVAGNLRTIDQNVNLRSDDVGVVRSALGAPPDLCPVEPVSNTAAHVELRVCVFGARDQSINANVGTAAWANCPTGDDACVTNNLNALIAPANQIWNGTIQFDLVGFKVLRDKTPPVKTGELPPAGCDRASRNYGDVCLDPDGCYEAGPEPDQAVIDCQNAWGFPGPNIMTRTRDACTRGLVLVVARRFLNIGLHGVGEQGNLCDYGCQDATTARNNQGAFAIVDEFEARPDGITVAHELGHAVGLKHGDGVDSDCNGVFDEYCDLIKGLGKESMEDDLAGTSLMSPSGPIPLLTNRQKNKARAFAMTTPPNAGLSGAGCPVVTIDTSVEVVGTPPPPKAGCGCATADGSEAAPAVIVVVGLAAAVARRKRRREQGRRVQLNGDDGT